MKDSEVKKSLTVFLLITGTLLAMSGQEVYEKKCASCPMLKIPMYKSQMMLMREKMQIASEARKSRNEKEDER